MPSRTAAVIEALRRMRSQQEDEREIAILKEMAANPDPDLEAFHEWSWQEAQRGWGALD